MINLSLGGPAGGPGDAVSCRRCRPPGRRRRRGGGGRKRRLEQRRRTPTVPCTLPRAEPHLRGGARPERRACRLLQLGRDDGGRGGAGLADPQLQDRLGGAVLQRGLRGRAHRLDHGPGPAPGRRPRQGPAARARRRRTARPARTPRTPTPRSRRPPRCCSAGRRLPHALRPEVGRRPLRRFLAGAVTDDPDVWRRHRLSGPVARIRGRGGVDLDVSTAGPTCTRPSSSARTAQRRATGPTWTTCACSAATRPTSTRSWARTTSRMRPPAATWRSAAPRWPLRTCPAWRRSSARRIRTRRAAR